MFAAGRLVEDRENAGRERNDEELADGEKKCKWGEVNLKLMKAQCTKGYSKKIRLRRGLSFDVVDETEIVEEATTEGACRHYCCSCSKIHSSMSSSRVIILPKVGKCGNLDHTRE